MEKLLWEPFRRLKSHYNDKAKQIGTCKTNHPPSHQEEKKI